MTDLHLTAGGHQANSQVPFPNADPALNEFESNFAVPPGGADPQTGKFHHFPAGNVHRVASTVSFHVVGGPTSTTIPAGVPFTLTFTAFFPGSQIYAFPFLTTASIGIEHVPEPAAPLLLLGGIVSLAFGCRARRRRKQA